MACMQAERRTDAVDDVTAAWRVSGRTWSFRRSRSPAGSAGWRCCSVPRRTKRWLRSGFRTGVSTCLRRSADPVSPTRSSLRNCRSH